MQKENQTNEKNKNLLTKVKMSLSGLLVAGMLVNPVTVNGMKNLNNHLETVRIEREAETSINQQQLLRDAKVLFQDIMDSSLSDAEEFATQDLISPDYMVQAEVTGYINRVAGIAGTIDELNNWGKDNDYRVRMRIDELRSIIKKGKIREVSAENKILDLFIDVARLYNFRGKNQALVNEIMQDLFREFSFEVKTIYLRSGSKDSASVSGGEKAGHSLRVRRDDVSVSEENGIRGNIHGILYHPEDKVLGMELIQKNINNMNVMMVGCGSKELREAMVWMYASIDFLNEKINNLEKAGYTFNENNLMPREVMSNQIEQEFLK